jgi:AcrR family transcriptional regulator
LREAADIDQAIRQAAIKALFERGQAATLNEVAHAAGLSRKSVYARYANKSALFQDVIRAMLADWRGVEFNASGDVEQRLSNYVRSALQSVYRPESRTIQRLLSVDPSHIAALRPQMIAATNTYFVLPLCALLDQANQAGELVVDDVAETARALIKMIFADAMTPDSLERPALDSDEQQRYAGFITRLITRGLLPRASVGGLGG